jgi:hypothetical protein
MADPLSPLSKTLTATASNWSIAQKSDGIAPYASELSPDFLQGRVADTPNAFIISMQEHGFQ